MLGTVLISNLLISNLEKNKQPNNENRILKREAKLLRLFDILYLKFFRNSKFNIRDSMFIQ